MKAKQRKTEQFIERAKEIHGDKYNYTKVSYINARTKVCIICPIHGEFWQTPDNHVNKLVNCPRCSSVHRAKKQTKTKEEFIKELKREDLDFSDIEYISYSSPIKNIRCKKHNLFFSVVSGQALKKGGYCPECVKEKRNHHKTNEEYIEELKTLQLDKVYDFSKINYINAKTPITMICKSCNAEFQHSPRSFLNGVVKACPNCNYYIGEKIIEEALKENNVKYIPQFRFTKTEISTLSFDFYLPDKNITIEYQGEQHFRAIKKWGGEERLKKQQKNDQRKRDFCKKNNIKEIEISKKDLKELLTIFEKEGIINQKEEKNDTFTYTHNIFNL